ncbi:hypothetical protein DPMN_158785 [Dreissena polymorpha]|uniref:Uncharacterized protein n=1 Tax=Dreissena polymorpha TaxID=45954 RepID=A0A9D4EN00_DREPO|nr:hypothetical protein DPMN_158785 [Dreissena polymorpha]
MLPSVVHIQLENVTVSSTWLRKLFNEHFKLEHEMTCELIECRMVGDKLFPCFTASMTIGVNNTFEISYISEESPGLWETLRGLNIKTLSLGMHVWDHVLKVKYASSFSQALTSLKNLETLRINVEAITPDLWSALYSLDIKLVALSLYAHLDGLILSHVGMLSQPSFSVSQIDLIYIDVNSKPDLLTALHGLNIKRLSLCGSGESLDLNQVLLLVTLLTSLEQLEYLCIYVSNDSLGLWFALKFLNIKILHIGIRGEGCKVNHAAYLSTLLPSLKNLETITFYVTDDISVLLEVLYGLKIKSLKSYEKQHLRLLEFDLTYYSSSLLEAHNSLNVRSLCLQLYRDMSTAMNMTQTQKSSLYHSLSSHTELETLSIEIHVDSLCEALRCLNVKILHLTVKYFHVDIKDAHQILPSLMSPTQLETLSIEMSTRLPDFMGCEFNHTLTSLKCLKVFNMYMTKYFKILLPQCLKDVTIYYEALTPLELRDLIQTLASCCQAVEVKLEFGCTRVSYDFKKSFTGLITPEDYITIQHEMNALQNVTIRRFRIWNRPFESTRWSACYIGNIASEDHIDDSDDDERYNKFIKNLNGYNLVVNRISIRLQIVTSIDLINK